MPRVYSTNLLRIHLGGAPEGGTFIQPVHVKTPAGWRRIALGEAGREFSTSLGGANALLHEANRLDDGSWQLVLSGSSEGWEADEVVTLEARRPVLRRVQKYRFTRACRGAVHPGWLVPAKSDIRYTFPLRAHEVRLADVPAMRSDVEWALPFPFHVWHSRGWVAAYGVDRSASAGTIDFIPADAAGVVSLRTYFPDTTTQHADFCGRPEIPDQCDFAAGQEVTLVELLLAKPVSADDEPLLEAERLAADVLLARPRPLSHLSATADGIADFYRHCQLWEPDALGAGRGWFRNMWVYTQRSQPRKDSYFDLGWGEGIAVEFFLGAIRNWKRTGRRDLLAYVDQMTRSIELFERGPGDDEPYFDRSTGQRFGDFMLDHTPPGRRVWSHSLGHVASELLQCYTEGVDYPNQATRRTWLDVARTISRFFANRQQANGDIQDVFDEQDREVNAKPHRISARAAVCGLWARLSSIEGDVGLLDRARRLAEAVGPEIERYEFHNQMIDGLASSMEFTDGESAYYVLEGLVPLYAATGDPATLAMCRKAAAFGIAWTYFFDLPRGLTGVARGGQCCRMPDFPLLYPIGPAKATGPLGSLSELTGDTFYRRMAEEMLCFIGHYHLTDPGVPWSGGMLHAIEQYSGKHWGPDKSGQVDSGMATGNSLAALELWLANRDPGQKRAFEKR